jgi:hypothetical protein
MTDDIIKRAEAIPRYWVPTGGGVEQHPAGLLYRKEDVDDILAAHKAAMARVAELEEALMRIKDLTQHNMPMTAQEEQWVHREACAALTKKDEANG